MAKKSNVGSWLYRPPFPETWKRTTLYSLARWRNGLAFRNIDFTPSGDAVIKIAEIKDGITAQTKFTSAQYDEKYRVRRGDLLFSWSGQPDSSIDAFWWRGADGWLNQHIFKVDPNEDVDRIFLFYLLRYLRPFFIEIARNKQTTGLGHVTKSDLEAMQVGLPDLQYQQALARTLGPLDDKICLNRRMNETLEAMARAFFKSWFVGLDVERVGADDLIRTSVLEVGDGYRAKNSELGPPGLPFIRAGDLDGGFDTSGAEVLNEASVPLARTKVSRPGDVAFTSKGTIGRLARVTSHSQQFVYSPQVCFWRSLDQDRIDSTILYCWMQDDDFKRQVLAVAGQTDMALYVSLRDQRQMKVPVFPASQGEVAGRIRPLLERGAALATESRTLGSLRDLLLPKLLSGELRVRDGERIVERPSDGVS